MSSHIPKAVLYHSPQYPWSAVALLALEEKGYGPDELELRVVDTTKGEQYATSFLRLSPRGVVPTLIVPLQRTLSEDVESRYKAVIGAVAIADFLDKSRSALSRTHTTSTLPAPVLTPATIAFASASKTIINDILHSAQADPTTLRLLSAVDDASLKSLSQEVLPSLTAQHQTVSTLLAGAEGGEVHVTEKVKGLWREKKTDVDSYLNVFSDAAESPGELKPDAKTAREEYFAKCKEAWEVGLQALITKLSKEMIGPFAGDQLSIADLHLMAWFSSIVKLVGGSLSDDGKTVAEKLEARIGNGFKLPLDFQRPEGQGGSGSAQSKLSDQANQLLRLQILTLILLLVLTISITLLFIYILNPDKEPLPWRAYCAVPSLSTNPPDLTSAAQHPYPIPSTPESTFPNFPPPDLDELTPAGLFIGVFSVDSADARRQLVRTTWASHARSRDGAGNGDGGVGTSRSIVRFILGQPRGDWDRRIRLEMEMYNDIIILPIQEKMNYGKTHTYFSWAAINAWVPPVYDHHQQPPQFSYSNYTTSPPPLAPHDPAAAWEDQNSGRYKSWVRPDYVLKVDDDSFVMLAELESRLRWHLHQKPGTPPFYAPAPDSTSSMAWMPWQGGNNNNNDKANATGVGSGSVSVSSVESVPTHYPRYPSVSANDPLIYWGYLVKNRFMAGELYALSWSLVDWVAKDPSVKALTKGAEDKQTSKWMRLHPRAHAIRWASEHCWIYDHPRSGTVYSHGFLFPSEVTRVKRGIKAHLDTAPQDVVAPVGGGSGGEGVGYTATPSEWAHSSVSTFGARYAPPIPELTIPQSVEALVEGSDMSMLREGSPMTPEYAMIHREGRRKRYEGKRVGGTVVVHFIKKNFWYMETALAFLEGEELSEAERYRKVEEAREAEEASGVVAGEDGQRVSGSQPTETMKRGIQWHRKR
ncbi:hypothetical protein ONZ45_g859 [Pleurotus djamor]|nr:hypothetical protein ONZ45_g859 [Pleurotus djamor]